MCGLLALDEQQQRFLQVRDETPLTRPSRLRNKFRFVELLPDKIKDFARDRFSRCFFTHVEKSPKSLNPAQQSIHIHNFWQNYLPVLLRKLESDLNADRAFGGHVGLRRGCPWRTFLNQ